MLSGFLNKIPPITHHEGMAGMWSGHPYVETGGLESHFGGPSIDQVAADVLSRNPGAEIIFDVKSTRNLYSWVRDRGEQLLSINLGSDTVVGGFEWFAHDAPDGAVAAQDRGLHR